MQNKKLLSVLLALMLVVTCAVSFLIIGAQAEERVQVTWTVGTEVESLADALADAKAKTDWTANDALVIDLNGASEEVTVDENGILFGLSTIFDDAGARLPITIQNGTLTLPEAFTGDMVCANSYTFKDLTFPIADAEVSFYAGSGEVTLDTVVLSAQELPTIDNSAKGNLYADCPVAAAFEGWAKPTDLIDVSLHLKNVNYKYGKAEKPGANVGAVNDTDGFEAENVSAKDLAVSLIFTDSNIQEVWLRDTDALSPVAELNFIVNDTSGNNSKQRIGRIDGLGRSWDSTVKVVYPDFDCNIEINGGKVDWASSLHRAASFTGDFYIEINGGVFSNELITTYGETVGTVTGKATLTVNGGEFKGSLYGVDAAGTNNVNNIYGGTIAKFQGTRLGCYVTNNVYGGKIATFCGHYDTKNGGGDTYIYNNIYGGEIGTYWGSGGTAAASASGDSGNYSLREVVNNMFGGKITDVMYGAGRQQKVYYVENNLNGTEIMGNFCGTANKGESTMAVYAVCNTMTSSKIHGNYNGGYTTMEKSNKHTDEDGTYNLKNKIIGGEVVGRFRGNSDASCMGNIINIISGGEFNTSTKYADRSLSFYASGNRAGQGVVTTVTGGNFYKSFVGASGNANTSAATTNLSGGTFNIYSGKAIFTDENGNPYYSEIAFDAEGTITSRADATATEITIGGTTFALPIAKGGENYDAIQAASTRPTSTYAIYGAESLKADTSTVTVNVTAGTYGTVYGASGSDRLMQSVTVNITGGEITKLYGTAAKAITSSVNVSGGKVGTLVAIGGAGGTHTVEDAAVNNAVVINQTGGYVGYFYSNDVNSTADVTFNATASKIYDRDDLQAHLAELPEIFSIYGVSKHDLKLTGDLTYNFKGIKITRGAANTGLSCGDIAGDVNALFENCYYDGRFFDLAGKTGELSQVTGNVSVKFKNTVLTQLNQFFNRDKCINGGTYTMELDSVKLTGSANFKPMNARGNTTATTTTVYIHGDTVLEAAHNYIAIHRQHGKAQGYIGVKPGENGELIPVPTTISGAGYVAVRYDNATTTAVGKLDVYDVTLDGADIRYYNGATNDDTADVITLKGDIALLNGAKVWADKVDAGSELVTVTSDTWNPEEAYVTLSDAADVAKLRGQIVGFAAGYPKRVDNTLQGALFSAPSASMTVKDRIHINLWLPKADVDDYFANDVLNTRGEAAMDFGVLMDKDLANKVIYELGSGTFTAADLDSMEAGDYYKIQLGAAAASDFDKDITFEGSCFTATASILEICEAGLDGEYTDEELDLFAALYNYGASVCIDPSTEEYYEFKDLGDDFIVDNKSDIAISAGATDKISFYQINLLMGDAVGIKLTGTVIDPEAVITATIGGQAAEGFYVSKSGDKVTVEFYVSAEDFDKDLEIVVLADGVAAATFAGSVEGYTEQVISWNTFGNAELALAQLVQACLNTRV